MFIEIEVVKLWTTARCNNSINLNKLLKIDLPSKLTLDDKITGL